MASNEYDIGDLPRLTATFEVSDVAADPTAVTFTLREPDGVLTTYTYPADAELVKDATGVYHVDWPVTKAGNHFYRFAGTGAAVAAEERQFVARVKKAQ